MANITAERFLECVNRSGLVAKDDLARALAAWKAADPAPWNDAELLATKFIEAKLLTRWQADNLLMGKSSGFLLGYYKILSVLATGHWCSIYLAEHTLTRVLRALKVLPFSRENDPVHLSRFLNQTIVTPCVSHPSIPQAIDAAQHGKHRYVVLEYVDGRNLQTIVDAEGPLEPRLAAEYIRQAAVALAHAHDRGLVHRDIRPNHLMINARETIAIIDWSLARSIGEIKPPPIAADRDKELWSTFDYLAPELATDVDLVDPRTDGYSLGSTLYFLLTGQPLFSGLTLLERRLRHQHPKRPHVHDERPEVPTALAELCMQMMARSPDDRPQSAKEVAAKLATFLLP